MVFPGVTVPLVVGRSHSVEALEQAGVGGYLVVATQVDPTTEEPYDLLTPDGCTSPGTLPIFEILRDSQTQQWLDQGSGDLFVVIDIENAILLRACG